jgi:[NiFe] hydrogenase assembly HybE family chaperone
MTSRSGFDDSLVAHFERVHEQHMAGLPILNPRLTVEAVATRKLGGQELCVLITPWFMNLMICPDSDDLDGMPVGEPVSIDLPHESLEFTVCRDADIGTYLSAVLFRTMTDFPDQQTAREIAQATVQQLFSEPEQARQQLIRRRALFTGLGAN